MGIKTESISLSQEGEFLIVTDDGDSYEIHAIARDREARVTGGPLGYRAERLDFDDNTVRVGVRMRIKKRGRTEITDKVANIYNISGMTVRQVMELKRELKSAGTASASRH